MAAKKKLSREALTGVLAQYADTVAKVSASEPEFWHALFGWAQHSREIVLLDPVANIEAIRHNVTSAAEQRARKAVSEMFERLTQMRHGHIRDTLALLPIAPALRFGQIPGLWHLTNSAMAIPFEIQGYLFSWRQNGRAFLFLTQRLSALTHAFQNWRNWDAAHIAKLYEAFPSNSPVQESFVRRANEIPHVKGRPRSLAQLGRVRNAELRRALVTVYGVKETGDALQRDDYGALYNVDEQTNAVHVTCPSTGREYWLGVPATCETAREAVLWTFGMTGESRVGAATLLKEA